MSGYPRFAATDSIGIVSANNFSRADYSATDVTYAEYKRARMSATSVPVAPASGAKAIHFVADR